MPSHFDFLYYIMPFGRRPETDHEKALRRETKSKVFNRYETDVDGVRIEPERGWLGTIWAFIRQPDSNNDFNPQYRKLPIVSGLLVPFSILMEIPGLTEHWYVRTDPVTHKPFEYQNNSALLEIGLAISITSAVIANLCLIARYLEKRVRASTIMAMLFLTLHDIINIITVGIFARRGSIQDGFTFAQAYWFTVASTIVSTITNVTLLIDYVRTKDFATSGSGLSHKQRSLVITVILLFTWVALGAGCFSALIDINFQDALYYSVVTMETIGFGDITPTSPGARVFVILWVTAAIFNLALAVTTIRDVVAEGMRQAAKQSRRRAARRKALRERQRMNTDPPPFIYDGGGRRTVDATGLDLYADAPSPTLFSWLVDMLKYWRKGLGDDEFSDDELDAAEPEPQLVLAEDQHLLIPRVAHPDLDQEYRQEVARADRRERRINLSMSIGALLLFWLIGAAIFHQTEGWAYGSALYFCYITFTTIGYGDLYPKTPAGRAIFVFWALLGVGGLTVFISVITELYAGAFSTAVESGSYSTQVYNRMQYRNLQARAAELERQNAALITDSMRLDTLAEDLITHARNFHPHMRHVLGIDGLRHRVDEEPSRSLKELLLNEMAAEDETTRRIVLKHPEMRKTVFTLAYDRSFDRLMQAAIAIRMQPPNPDSARETRPPTPSSPRARPSLDATDLMYAGPYTAFELEDANTDLDLSAVADNHVDNHVHN